MRKKGTKTSIFAALGLAAGSMAMGACASNQQSATENPTSSAASLPAEKTTGALEQVAAFTGPMPTGVTVADGRRIFVNYPRWGDPVEFSVAEIRNGQAVAYPNTEINKLDTARAAQTFVSVQSVVVDPRNRL